MGNKPRIRFKGFTEDWEQRKFSDITYLSGVKNKENKPYESYSISNEFGFIPQDEQFENGGTMKTANKSMYYIVSQNSFAYNPARINVGSIGYYDKPDNVIVSSLYEVFKTTEIVNDKFLWHWFKSSQFNHLIEKYQEGGVRLYFYYDKLCKGTIELPTINEQNKISNLLDSLDMYITLHQCKLEKLKLTKKALLQKLFPKNGKHIPEIRFKGFTDAWEQRKFSDIFAEVKSGLSRMLSNDDIGLPVVRANNINDGQLNLADDIKYWYKNDPQGANTNNYLIDQGDILINFINSEAKMGTAAYVTRRPERDTIYTTNILRCKVNDEYNSYFIYSLTFLNSYKNYIASITKPAVNQASFTTVDFKKYSIKIPTEKEQNQIANLIETFNQLITLHQRKLERLQEVKKGLLQKMFV